jgi:hypothetical protein
MIALAVASAACTTVRPLDDAPRATMAAPIAPPSVVAAAVPTDVVSPPQAESEEATAPLLDAWSLAAKEDGAACRKDLADAGFGFRALGDNAKPDKTGCGIPHPVLVFRGPTRIVYDPPVTVDCSLARAFGDVERIVQEEAETHLHARIARIGTLGGFACRPRNYRRGASLSAHAFGSAVDLASFHPVKGTPAIIDRDWEEPKKSTPLREDRRSFLHAVFQRLRRHEADLTYAVGPDFNAIHHNHFHLDRGGWHFWFNR